MADLIRIAREPELCDECGVKEHPQLVQVVVVVFLKLTTMPNAVTEPRTD